MRLVFPMCLWRQLVSLKLPLLPLHPLWVPSAHLTTIFPGQRLALKSAMRNANKTTVSIIRSNKDIRLAKTDFKWHDNGWNATTMVSVITCQAELFCWFVTVCVCTTEAVHWFPGRYSQSEPDMPTVLLSLVYCIFIIILYCTWSPLICNTYILH